MPIFPSKPLVKRKKKQLTADDELQNQVNQRIQETGAVRGVPDLNPQTTTKGEIPKPTETKTKSSGTINKPFSPQAEETERRFLSETELENRRGEFFKSLERESPEIRTGLVQGFEEAVSQARTRDRRELASKALERLGLSVPANVDLDTGDLLTTSLLAAPSAGAGIAGGAALGARVAGGAGTIAGGVIGGLFALQNKISADKKQATRESLALFRSTKERHREIMNLANSGQNNPSDVIDLYNQNFANLLEARDNLRLLTKNKVGKQLSNAQDRLIQVESYIQFENIRRAELSAALLNPDPNKIVSVTPEPEEQETGGLLSQIF